MTMQVHRVRHAGVVGEINFHAFTNSNVERAAIGVSRAINCPDIILHVAAKCCGQGAVGGLRGQGSGSAKV